MITKYYEINKYKEKLKLYLFYGENEGLKHETIQSNFNNFDKENTHRYNEKDIITDKESILNNIYSKSFFEKEKLIIISEVTDKILSLVEEIVKTNISDVILIFIAEKLEKRSKIRTFFEKNENVLCVPFYEDTAQTLISIAQKFLQTNKINFSYEKLNLIVERARGDRISLKNELEKIKVLSQNRKNIKFDDILKLTNLSENYSVSELVDNCLCQNRKKTLHILNENIPSSEDNIIILKTFLYKLKRLRKLKIQSNYDNDIEKAINSFKPPIFWKDKGIVKKQLQTWKLDDIQNFIIDVNNLESLIKQNPQISNHITNNMILDRLN